MSTNNSPLLSICIPTYNRETYLKQCLESIIHQDAFDETRIEIVISDNASSDNTTQICEEYTQKYSNIFYFRNTSNIWAVKNIAGLPSLAHWEYVWFLSDDDLLSPIWISEMLQAIQKNAPDFILSHFLWFWNGETIPYDKIDTTGQLIDIKGMDNFFTFLWETRYDITSYVMLLSIFCFKKTLYIENMDFLLKEYGEKYIDILLEDNFIHSRIIYLPFWNKKRICVIEKDLVLCRWNNISWKITFQVCRDLLKLIHDLNSRYRISKKTLWRLKNVYYYGIFSYIIIAHVQRYLPKSLYNFMILLARTVMKYIRKIKYSI